MTKNFTLKLLAFIMLISSVTFTSCKKAQELNDAIDDVIDEMLGITALTEELDKTSSNFNEISNLVINGKSFTNGTTIKMTLPSSVPFSFTKKRYTLSGSAWNTSTNTYSGTLGKSRFTNKSTNNTFKIAISGNNPVLSVNGTTAISSWGSGTTPDPNPGTNPNPGTGTGGTTTLVDREVTGTMYGLTTVSFTVPSGVKSMKILITEKTVSYRQFADLFVRRGSAPLVTGPKPSNNYAKYTWTSDYSDIGANREDRSVTVSNPSSGTWYAGLYGYNMAFQSQLIVTYTK